MNESRDEQTPPSALRTRIRRWLSGGFGRLPRAAVTSEGPVATWQDGSRRLPNRLPLRCWVLAITLFVVCYGFMWSYVHVRADTTACLTRLVDPLFPLIAHDGRWAFVTHDVYEVLTICLVTGLFWQAWRGDQRPLVRFGTALALQAALRSMTILLLPVCRVSVEPGTIPLAEVPVLDLGFMEIPWRVWATNDMIFSGHVGEFLLIYWATRGWPRPVRVGLVLFQIVQAYGLIATRGHYTVDIVLAIPCAFFADSMAIELLDRVARPFKGSRNQKTPLHARAPGSVNAVSGVQKVS